MRHPIDFLEEMVSDVIDFDFDNLETLTTPDITIALLLAAPGNASILENTATFFQQKYPDYDVTFNRASSSIDFNIDGLNLHIVPCDTEMQLRGLTCAGAVHDTYRILTEAEQRTLHTSLLTLRWFGFSSHMVTLETGL
jgi:hypothetical protein